MIEPPSPEAAVARWLAQGVTSQTHPVLAFAFRRFLHPLGVEAEWLEVEPFSVLESGQGGWWLRGPRWDPARFDPRHPALPDFAVLLSHPGHFTVDVDDRGLLSLELAPAARNDPAALLFMEDSGRGWQAVRHTARAAADAECFLYAAAGLILACDPAADAYAAGDERAFCEEILGRLREARGA
jgi:hypothetical protein